MSASSPFITSTTTETFDQDVVERSRSVPVVLDFWATWCPPCVKLGPMLEKLAKEYAGKFMLVKADCDQCGEIASEFQVQSIPTVFGIKDGAVVNAFQGLISERELRLFLESLMPTAAEKALAEAKDLEATDLSAACARYEVALGLDADLVKARVGIARVCLKLGDQAAAWAQLKELESRAIEDPEAERIKAELILMEQGKSAGGVDSARAAVEADHKNLAKLLQLAEALVAEKQYPEALDVCLDLVELDRKGVGEEARKLMLAIFRLFPEGDELVVEYQRKLSLAL